MEGYDKEKLDEVVLALLWLNSFSDRWATRAWKSFDWDTLDRLHEKGYISDPQSKAKSVVMTDEGLELAEALFEKYFGLSDSDRDASFAGTWHIYEMEMWDENYFNMEVQAYIEIDDNGYGHFQFGLVSGQIDGEVVKDDEAERFEFTWEGNDELDPVSGSGRLKLVDADRLEGRIDIHYGDSSKLWAKRAG